MSRTRPIRVPSNIYNQALKVQIRFLSDGKRVPLWKCLTIKEDPDDIVRRLRL